MIKNKNIAIDAMIDLAKIAGNETGETRYVANSTTQAYSWLGSRVKSSKLHKTIDAAINACVASRGDKIKVAPFHTETISTASGITADVAGISIEGIGPSAAWPILTFSAVDATFVISGASITLKNIIVKPSVDSVVSPIVVSGADCTIDIEVQDASATVECVRAILATAGADRLDVKLKYRGFLAGDACYNAIRLVGVDTARIYVDFYGKTTHASSAIVEFSGTACHDIDIKGKFYNESVALTKNVVDTITGSTWSAEGWDGKLDANFSGGNNAALATDDVTGINTELAKVPKSDSTVSWNATALAAINTEVDGALNTAVPLTPTGNSLNDTLSKLDGANTFDNTTDSLEAIRDRVDTLNLADQVDLDAILEDTGTTLPATLASQSDVDTSATAVMVNGNTLFTITGGAILVESLVSECVTGNDATASTLQYSATPTVGAATAISAATTTLASVAAGYTISLRGTALDTVPALSVGGPNLGMTAPMVVPAGTIKAVVGGGSTTGTWKHHIRYRPLAAGVTVA